MEMKIGSVPAAQNSGYVRPMARVAELNDFLNGSDKLEISEMSRLQAQTLRAAQAAPEVRADKVKEISERIAAGTYSVDSRAIADKILGK